MSEHRACGRQCIMDHHLILAYEEGRYGHYYHFTMRKLRFRKINLLKVMLLTGGPTPGHSL